MSERNETKAYSAQPLWFETKTDDENLCRLIRHKDNIIADLNKDIDAMGRKCKVLELDRNHFEEHCIRRSEVEGRLQGQIEQYRMQQVILENEVLTLKMDIRSANNHLCKMNKYCDTLKESKVMFEKQKEEQITRYKQQNEQLTSAIFKQESEVLALKEENETLKAQLEIEKFKGECSDGKLNKIREIL